MVLRNHMPLPEGAALEVAGAPRFCVLSTLKLSVCKNPQADY